MTKPKGISILSGGLDCTVATSIYSNDYDLTAITFNYGQQSLDQEIKHAKLICKELMKSCPLILFSCYKRYKIAYFFASYIFGIVSKNSMPTIYFI